MRPAKGRRKLEPLVPHRGVKMVDFSLKTRLKSSIISSLESLLYHESTILAR